MAAVARYLADKSALARLYDPEVRSFLAPLIEAGLVATCAAIEFQFLWSTWSPAEYHTVHTDRSAGYELLATEDIDWQRALKVQKQLWQTGRMRTIPGPDLLIAAVAERCRVTVLHYDGDYDTIAELSGQPTRWVVERGTVA